MTQVATKLPKSGYVAAMGMIIKVLAVFWRMSKITWIYEPSKNQIFLGRAVGQRVSYRVRPESSTVKYSPVKFVNRSVIQSVRSLSSSVHFSIVLYN